MSKSTGVATLKWLEYKYLKLSTWTAGFKMELFPKYKHSEETKSTDMDLFPWYLRTNLRSLLCRQIHPHQPMLSLPNWGKSAVLPWSQIQKIEFINETCLKNGAVFAFFGPFLGGNYIGKVPRVGFWIVHVWKKSKGWAARAEANRLQSEHPSDLLSVIAAVSWCQVF